MKIRLFLCSIFLFFFSLYWMVTIFFNLPNNYTKIKASRQEIYFHFFLFQKWGFFAPPPTFDDRLYFFYKSASDSTITSVVEVLEKLYKEKSRKAPFNSKEDLLDYFLSNSIGALTEEVVDSREYKRFALVTKRLEKDTTITPLLRKEVESTSHFKTIINYGKIVAQNELKNQKIDSIAFLITRIHLPIFAKRFEKEPKKEEVFFRSNYISIDKSK